MKDTGEKNRFRKYTTIKMHDIEMEKSYRYLIWAQAAIVDFEDLLGWKEKRDEMDVTTSSLTSTGMLLPGMIMSIG